MRGQPLCLLWWVSYIWKWKPETKSYRSILSGINTINTRTKIIISLNCHLLQFMECLQEDPQVCWCDFILLHSAVEVYKLQCAGYVEEDESFRPRTIWLQHWQHWLAIYVQSVYARFACPPGTGDTWNLGCCKETL